MRNILNLQRDMKETFILGLQPQIEVVNRQKDIVCERKNTHASGEFLARST